MAGFTKLQSSIVHSTIWREPNHVRIVWITMLAICDKNGKVESSIPGLADVARVDLSECKDAIDRLAAPDEYSRSQEHDGRRIAETEGGWIILNYIKYRGEERSAKLNRERQRRFREKQRAESNVTITLPNVNNGHNAQSESESEADTEREREPARADRTNKKDTGDRPGLKNPDAAYALDLIISFEPWADYPYQHARETAVTLVSHYGKAIDVPGTIEAARAGWPPGRSIHDRGGLHSYLSSYCSNEAARAREELAKKPKVNPIDVPGQGYFDPEAQV